MNKENKFNAFSAFWKSAYETDYSNFKRKYERDQVKVEKIFWSTVLGIYHKCGKINIESVFIALVAILYDKPSLEFSLLSNFEGRSRSEFNFEESQRKLVQAKYEEGEKIKQDLINFLEQFVQKSVVKQPPQEMELNLTRNHQPNLPSISMVVNELRTITHGVRVDGPLYYPFERKLSLSQLNRLRKISGAYLAHFFAEILSGRIYAWHNTSEEIFYRKKRVYSVGDAVVDKANTHPGELGYSDIQLAHRIFCSYCDQNGIDFETDSILKAIRRYYRNV